jgi:hypothetical protein
MAALSTVTLRAVGRPIGYARGMHRLALLLALFAAPAAADPLRATYGVQAAGLSVMEVRALLDLARPGAYRIETRFRTLGLAARLFPGEQTTRAEGRIAADGPRPLSYLTEGIWRGETRRVRLDYRDGLPSVGVMEPPNDREREAVPPELARDTVDNLTAIVLLARRSAETGSCDGEAAVFDGRRRLDVTARTEGWFTLPGGRGHQAGPLLRCRLESRLVAGFRFADDRATAARPQRTVVWIAPSREWGTSLPVRVEFESRLAGTVLAELRELERAR